MSPTINGKTIAEKIEKDAANRVVKLKKKGITPKLAVIFVGEDKPSATYIRKKQEAAARAGIEFSLHNLPINISENELVKYSQKLQEDKNLTGLIIQLPLPENLYTPMVLNSINPKIDVDCLTDANKGKLVMKTNYIEPPTPWAVIEILKEINVDLAGKNVVIIGMGALVGKPLAIMMVNALASITTCNSHTKNIKEKCRQADIIIMAVGKKDLLRGNMVKKGAIVIDTGIVFVEGKMYGDVNFKEVSKKASYITPTPGGVGPITVSKLLLNTVICAEKNN